MIMVEWLFYWQQVTKKIINSFYKINIEIDKIIERRNEKEIDKLISIITESCNFVVNKLMDNTTKYRGDM